MIQYLNDMLDFSNDEKEECIICFEDKKLKSFCKNHKFCDKCCKDWIKKSSLCPLCRLNCINIKYSKYVFELKGDLKNEIDNSFIANLEFFFSRWHKESCLKKKHKFDIRTVHNNLDNRRYYVLHCTECHVEQEYLDLFYLFSNR
jgi:hypothetical protein